LTAGGAPSQRIKAVVNVPLVDDALAVRLAGQFDHEGGWIDQPSANLVDINDHNIADVRAKLLWQPDSQFSADAMVEIHRNDGVMDNGEGANGNYIQPFNLSTQRRVTNKYDLYNITASYDLAAARLLSTTTYFDQDNEVYNYGWFGQFTAPPSALAEIYIPRIVTKSHALNEELRLMSTGTTAWKWTLGVFYATSIRHPCSRPITSLCLRPRARRHQLFRASST
jgi:iron complex outermembrane receptor protein